MTATEAEPPPLQATPEPVRLWLPRDVLITSFLLGYPGGIGLVARNAWRLGRRSTAWFLLVGGAIVIALVAFVLPDDVPTSVSYGLNAGFAWALYSLARGQVETVKGAGGVVVRAPALSGFATFLGGWLVSAGPTILIVLALTAFGGQVLPAQAGKIVFGTSGSDCDVTAASTIRSGGQMHWVAYLSREAKDGETIHVSVRGPDGSDAPSDIDVEGTAVCVSGMTVAFGLPGETYAFELTIGPERLAYGEVTFSGP